MSECVWDAGKRPSCTRLKDLDSAGMEKFDHILRAYRAMSAFPRRHGKYQDFNNVHGAGVGGREKARKRRKKINQNRRNQALK